MCYLHQAFPKHIACPLTVDLHDAEHISVRIGDCGKPINLDASFGYQAYKNGGPARLGTAGMLPHITIGQQPRSVRVLSQWQGDVVAAKKLGMQAGQQSDSSLHFSIDAI